MPNYRCNSSEAMRCNHNGPRGTGMQRQMPMQNCEPVGCVRKEACCDDRTEYDELSGMPLAMAYVPMQQFQSIYELDEALQNGTVFPELNKPFMGWKGGCSC